MKTEFKSIGTYGTLHYDFLRKVEILFFPGKILSRLFEVNRRDK